MVIRLLATFGLMALALSWSAAASAEETGEFTQEIFDTWIEARAGTGAPVYWYSTGTVRAYPSGELLYTMEGFDTAVAYRPEGRGAPIAHQYGRKIFIYRDPATGEVAREAGGMAIDPIAYPYQFIEYRLEEGDVIAVVEQGSGGRIQSIEAEPMSWRRLGDTYIFTAPLFLDFAIPGTDRRIEAWENYDFFIQPEGVERRHQLSWARIGRMPPWAGGQMAVLHLVNWRVDTYEELPASIRAYVEAEAPLWLSPPADLAAIRALQEGE